MTRAAVSGCVCSRCVGECSDSPQSCFGCPRVNISAPMIRIEQRRCFKLTTFVYITSLLMMVTYIIIGVGSIVWFVLSQHQDILQISVIILGILLVTCLLGLFACLLLVMGLVTKQVKLIIPWLLFHIR